MIFARARALLVLLVLSAAALVGLSSPAWADPCDSPNANPQYVISSVVIAQSSATSNVSTSLTINGQVNGQGTDGQPIQSACVSLTISGTNAMPAQAMTLDKNGAFTFSYTGSSTPGQDVISARAGTDSTGASPSSKRLVHTWVKPTPPSKTPSPTPSPTKSPTPSPTPSPTKSPTPSPTASPTASPTPTPTPTVTASPTSSPAPVPTQTLDPGTIHLDSPSALPGGSATVSGSNCPAGSPVTFTVEGTPAGSSTAQADGTFEGAVQLPDASLGQHLIQVSCADRTASVPIDLVVSSSSSASSAAGATAAAILVFFLLLGSILFARNHGRAKNAATPSE